jgi:hypothetical protein
VVLYQSGDDLQASTRLTRRPVGGHPEVAPLTPAQHAVQGPVEWKSPRHPYPLTSRVLEWPWCQYSRQD